ncbi:UDP-glucose 4-epimerase GalE [Lignipirellula cremea]|uniref:UDP-glucose 4-epimerase n=1 Tax=Lignipirellula cremea TaxID=2528010 RepID=A0A518E3R1_9BACT|nr:UDP-glucose 4-epimerase GalE [Lignipirellula cremea]QDU98735.1 UDP-glucose 4-epimerase [Lignipirellula cremea]
MRIMIAGGAGYVGSHTTRLLAEAGHETWVYDNLSRGHQGAVLPGQLIRGELEDRPLLESVLREKRIEAVMHFAAFIEVGESVVDPARYYQNNLVATLSLLEAMRSVGVQRLVFSSTAATYGEPETIPIPEDTPQKPINPYGFTKLVVEHALADYAAAYNLGYAALRYFNASGASPSGQIGEDHRPESHLIPLVLQVALGQRKEIRIFGDDFPTPDGTCIRDYVHVNDIGQAHILALSRLEPGVQLKYNLGVGQGFSVRQVIDACRTVTGHPIPAVVTPRRDGDAPVLIADSTKVREELHWVPQFDQLEATVETAWRWHRSHPHGYADA